MFLWMEPQLTFCYNCCRAVHIVGALHIVGWLLDWLISYGANLHSERISPVSMHSSFLWMAICPTEIFPRENPSFPPYLIS